MTARPFLLSYLYPERQPQMLHEDLEPDQDQDAAAGDLGRALELRPERGPDRDAGRAEILSGLAPGDPVVVQGQTQLYDGRKIGVK